MAPSPKLIGKYEILEELGRGGFAVVYKARDVELDRIVALKVLRPALSDDPDFVARFKQEARAVARLQHPNIVIVHDAVQIDGQLIIAMQYVESRTLRDELAQGPLPRDRVLTILEQIASALDYAQLRGVVHRDVKPANILLEETSQGVHAILLDFGLAKAMEASTALTSQGTLLGSPEYMAPEQADPNRAHEISPATDRYALGIVAYQLLTGRVPFPGNTSATLNAHLNLAPPDPHTLRAEVSPQVSTVLLKMLAKAPAGRYASAREFVAALRMAAVTPVSAPRVTVPRSAQSPIETARKPEVITPVPSIPRKGLGRVWRMLLWLLAVLLIGFVCYKILSGLVKPPSPSISSFTANPRTITLGECTTLSWQTTNVLTPIELFVNKETFQTNLPPSGSTSHCPTATGSFLYYISTVPAGSTRALESTAAVVNVVASTPPPQPTPGIDSFTANPSTLALGECTTLSWQTTDVVTPIVLEVNKQPLQTNLPPSGSTSHCPTEVGEFVYFLTVTAGSTQGSVAAAARVNVIAPTHKIDSFTANPSTLTLGECTTLRWQTTDVVTPIVLEVNKQTLQTNLPSSGSTSHCPTEVGEFVYFLIVTASSTQGSVAAEARANVVAPTLGIGSTRTRTADGMTMVYVPGGTFKMGRDIDFSGDKPVHSVTLDGYWIDRTEVTNEQYARCVTAQQCSAPSVKRSDTRDSYYDNPEFANYPVIYVSWEDANKYCGWAGGHLPTEAQWEYASRGPNAYTYPWGNEPANDALLNYNQRIGDTTAVGAYPKGASWVGALDLAGNVSEWVSDWYGIYPDSPQTNPAGPATGDSRVLRGGYWKSNFIGVSSSYHYDSRPPDSRMSYAGFRCVGTPGG